MKRYYSPEWAQVLGAIAIGLLAIFSMLIWLVPDDNSYVVHRRYENLVLKLRLEKRRQEWHKECTSIPEVTNVTAENLPPSDASLGTGEPNQ